MLVFFFPLDFNWISSRSLSCFYFNRFIIYSTAHFVDVIYSTLIIYFCLPTHVLFYIYFVFPFQVSSIQLKRMTKRKKKTQNKNVIQSVTRVIWTISSVTILHILLIRFITCLWQQRKWKFHRKNLMI